MANALLHGAMLWARRRQWTPMERAARTPDVAQQQVLGQVLAANRDTRFGSEHGFSGVRNHAQFQERVPVQDYESLRPFIEEQRVTGRPALTSEAPVFYAQTSGTTSRPKHIPVTPSALAVQRDEQALFSYLQFRACPAAFQGRALGIMGAAVEGRLDSGHIVGSVSGHLYQRLPRVLQSRFVVPPDVFGILDYDLKYLVILRLALAVPDVTYIGTPNPSTFLRLLQILEEQRHRLLDSLATGRLDELDAVAPAIREGIASRLTADPSRAAHLRSLPSLTFATVWPGIRLATTWMGGSCGIALARVRTTLPPAALVMELGYQSSECRGTIALEPETPAGVPPLHHHFLEFIEQEAWDRGDRDCLALEEIRSGRRYYVLFTTASGLYRYFMNDLVEVTGFFHRTPLLRFVQKGRGVTSLTGEKLYESQVIEAVQAAAAQRGLTVPFFLLVADEESTGYRLFVEIDERDAEPWMSAAPAMAVDVDERLGALNLEYRSKRTSGRLVPPTLAWLRSGAHEAYKAAAVRGGQREGQFKPAVLQYRRDLLLRLDDYVMPSRP